MGLLGSVMGVLDNVFGVAGQKDANIKNLQIARETNAQNALLAREANDLNYKMFKEQQDYNSPLTQRALLEQAGYNPASLTQGNYNVVNSSPNAATPGNAMQAAHMIAPPSYFNQLSQVAPFLASLAQAKKDNESAKGQMIDNEAKKQQYDLMFKGMGLDNAMKELDVKFADDTFDQRLERLFNESKISAEQYREINMRNAVYQLTGQKHAEATIDQLKALAEKSRAEGKQALSQVDLNKILGDTSKSQAHYYDVQSWYQNNILKSEIYKNEAIAEEAHSQAGVNRYEEQIKRTSAVIGRATQNYQIKSIINDYFNGKQDIKTKEALIKKIASEVGKIDAEVDYLDVKTYLDIVEETRKVFHEYIKMP